MINYLSSSFIYTKVANLILWFYADFIMGIIYAITFICKYNVVCSLLYCEIHVELIPVMGLLLPEPAYSGPDNVIYFHGPNSLEEELARDKRIVWVVAFYTVWNPACVNFAPIFAQLSTDFGLENLKFGKVDVGRYPDAGKNYRVNDSSLSKQLPTIVIFKEGKENDRRPLIDSKGKVTKFLFSDENIKAAFDLKNLHDNCKSELKKRKNHPKSD